MIKFLTNVKIGDKSSQIWLLSNDYWHIEIMDYGLTFYRLKFMGTDLLLFQSDFNKYLDQKNYLNCIVGPNANRIKNGIMNFFGNKITLDKNEENANLHSGFESFSKQSWRIVDYDQSQITFMINWNAFKEGMIPGEYDFYVKLTLIDQKIKIEYFTGEIARPSLINVTHHFYFNFNAPFKHLPITNHCLQMPVDLMFETDSNNNATGIAIPANRALWNCSIKNLLESAKPKKFFLDNFLTLKNEKLIILKANNVRLSFETSQVGLQFYLVPDFSAICWEFSNVLTGCDHGAYASNAYMPGSKYRSYLFITGGVYS